MPEPSAIPADRVRVLGSGPVRSDGEYVLYWMTAARRPAWNFALDRAVELARELDRPLIVLEALRAGYPFACDRFHGFVMDGMAANAAAFEGSGVHYYPYLEPEAGAGRGLVAYLAGKACAVVTDDYPVFFLPRMLERAQEEVTIRFEAVDSNGLMPMRATTQLFSRAYDFRRYLQRNLGERLGELPSEASPSGLRPLGNSGDELQAELPSRWPRVRGLGDEGAREELFASLAIDHDVRPTSMKGGYRAGTERLAHFLREGLGRYGEDRNQPEKEGTSGLSPYLHFGHVGAHQVFRALADQQGWKPSFLGQERTGKRSGWWGVSETAEGYLDQLVTWRELGFNRCSLRTDYANYESLPAWARTTLEEHAGDRRPHLYGSEEFEEARTHDELWNAAQRQLVREGRMHNYLRMLWGKKILHWSPDARSALRVMIHLNDKYAIDGRDPNSYSGMFWVLGRYDRAWGPEREVFGKVRYMSSANTRRKLRVKPYLERYGPPQTEKLFPSEG